MEQTLADPPLTLADRCDRCGAEAQKRFRFVAGELLFCGHHAREYAVKLAEKSITSIPVQS